MESPENPRVAIYQLRDTDERLYKSYDAIGKKPVYEDYDLVYLYEEEGYTVFCEDDGDKPCLNLHEVRVKLNGNLPDSFSHALSVSDVLVISYKDYITSYFVDHMGVKRLENFTDSLIKNNGGYIIKRMFSDGGELSDILCKNRDVAIYDLKNELTDILMAETDRKALSSADLDVERGTARVVYKDGSVLKMAVEKY